MVVAYNPFHMRVNLAHKYSVKDFCISVHKGQWFVIFVQSLYLALLSGNAGHKEGVRKCFLLCNILEKCKKDCFYFFKGLVEFNSKANRSGLDSISLLVIGLLRFCFFMIQSGQVSCFQQFAHFISISNMLIHNRSQQPFIILLFCRTGNNVPTFNF